MSLQQQRYLAHAVGKTEEMPLYAATYQLRAHGVQSAKRELAHFVGMDEGTPLYAISRCDFPRMGRYLARYVAIDGLPVRHLFLIVAPPLEVANQYLPTLGALAQFARDTTNVQRLERATTPEAVAALLKGGG